MRYIVQPTETFPSIAEARGHSGEWQVLAQLNAGKNLDPGQLFAGVELELPDDWALETERAPTPTPTRSKSSSSSS